MPAVINNVNAVLFIFYSPFITLNIYAYVRMTLHEKTQSGSDLISDPALRLSVRLEFVFGIRFYAPAVEFTIGVVA